MLLGRAGRAAAALVSALTVAACSASSGSSASSPTVTPGTGLHWTRCSGGAGPSGYQCATVQVPRNPQDPASGGTVAMAVDRTAASGPKVGSLLIDPGGPGGSGVDFLPQAVAMLPESFKKHFDVIGFDPPGVDRTAPVTCLGSVPLQQYFAYDPAPTTVAGVSGLEAEDRRYAQGCEQRSGAELPYVGTVDAAIDMDYIRAAVGDPQLNYLGFSYGTFLGATYASLYPTRVRAMVLDGAIDPALTPLASDAQQAVAFQADLRNALDACAADRTCPWTPNGDPVQAYGSLARRVAATPLKVPHSSRTVGASAFLYATAFTLYDPSTWPDLYDMLAAAAQGNGRDAQVLADAYEGRQPDGTYDNEFEANAAVNCLDAPHPTRAAVEAAAAASRAAAPVFGPAVAYSELQCAVWPVPATGHPGPIHAHGAPPILVVGSTGDPATPYADARALASELDHGVLLTRVGDGHTAYPYSSCIRNYVDAYLLELTLPPSGTSCPSGK